MKDEPYIPVADVIRQEVKLIDRMATVREAMIKMAEEGVSALVIERHGENDELGLVVVTDIAREVMAKNLSPDRVNVYEIMSKPVITLPSDMDIKYAIRLLTKIGISRGVVVDHERDPAGMATLRDMVLRYAQSSS